ncbi:MAG: hypothetical protein ACI808_001205 [Paraglaciecola sp.]|jgi:hypothetical protein
MLNLADKSDLRALKEFARTMIWAFPVIFMGILPWLFEQPIHWWPGVISAVLTLLYFAYPAGLYYPYRLWMAIASVLAWINTRLILGIAFFLLIMPIGLWMRFLGKLQYKTKISNSAGDDNDNNSYWIKRTDKLDKNNLENPF